MLAHSYWTNTPVNYMKRIRLQLRDRLKKYNAKFWQSEICIMSNDEEIGGGGGYDFSMKTALYVARIIHHDLCYANAESWSWWRACGGNYKDGLIRIYDNPRRRRGGATAPEPHRAQDSRLMWALGNYSRFVRPGAVRYEITSVELDRSGLRGRVKTHTVAKCLNTDEIKNVDIIYYWMKDPQEGWCMKLESSLHAPSSSK